MHGKGHVGIGAVNGTAGGINQVFYIVVTAAFQDIGKPDDVAVDIGVGIFQ
jgi:hypothetical protein